MAWDSCRRARRWEQGIPGYIPVSEIHSFAEMFEVESLRERKELLQVIQAMDDAWVSHFIENRPMTAPGKSDPQFKIGGGGG